MKEEVIFADKIKIPPDTKMLAVVRRFFKSVITKYATHTLWLDNLLVAVDEILANIILHGFGFKKNGFIHIKIAVDKMKTKIVIYDNGKYFNVEKYKPEEPLENIKRKKYHGFGIYIAKKYIDEIRYSRLKKTKQNKLTLIKYF